MSAMAAPGRPAARMDRGVGPDRAGAGDRACRNTRPARGAAARRPAAGARGAAVVVRQQPGLTTAVSGGRRGGGGQPQHRPRLPPSGRRHPCPSRQRPRRGRPDPGGPGRDRRSGRPRDPGQGFGQIVLFAAGLLLLGYGVQQVYWSTTRIWRKRALASPLDTVAERLKVVGQRLAYNLLWLLSFALGSLGALLMFNWPPHPQDDPGRDLPGRRHRPPCGSRSQIPAVPEQSCCACSR